MELEVSTIIGRPVATVWDLIDGWAFFVAHGDEETELTIGGEFHGIDDEMKMRIEPLMERSAANIKALIESET